MMLLFQHANAATKFPVQHQMLIL